MVPRSIKASSMFWVFHVHKTADTIFPVSLLWYWSQHSDVNSIGLQALDFDF